MKFKMLIWVGLLASPAMGQSNDPSGPDDGERGGRQRSRERGDRGDRDGRRERRPREDRGDREGRGPGGGGDRGGWERFQNATPQERQQMRADQMVNQAARLYELDDMQKERVRQEITAIQAERRAQMGAEGEEYDQLRAKTFDHWAKARESAGDRTRDPKYWEEVRQSPELQSARKRLREIDAKYPFNFEDQLKRVETLLPADQVAKGRQRWDERRARRNDEGGTFRRRNENEGERRTRDERRQTERAAESLRGPNGANGANPLPPPQPAPPPHPWEVHTRGFIKQYELSEAQSAASLGVLKDMRQRAEQLETVTAGRAAAMTDAAGRKKIEDDSKQQIEGLFAELKQRLESLLTAAQRAGAKP